MMSAALKLSAPVGRPHKRLRTVASAFCEDLRLAMLRQECLTFADLAERYGDDPCGFARDIIGVESWVKQDEILEAIRDHDKVTVRAGQKLSKSYAACIAAIWWFCTKPGSKVVFMSPSAKQVRETLYGQIREFFEAIRQRHPGLLEGEGVRVADLPETGAQCTSFRTIKGVTAHDDGSIAGMGGKDTLWILDESSHIKESIFMGVDGNTASGGSKILAISNPRLTYGWFYDSHNKEKEFWHCIHLSALDSINVIEGYEVIKGLVTREYLERRRRQWDETSARFQVLVMGNFAVNDNGKMFPFDRVEAAMERKLSDDSPLVIGLDPAGASEKADEIAIAGVRGLACQGLKTTRSKDANSLVEWAMGWIRDWSLKGEVPEVRLDAAGAVGAEVLGSMRAYERQHPGSFRLVPITSSDKARHNRTAFATIRDEMGDALEQWFKTGSIESDDLLAEELAVMEWEVDGKGRNKLIQKPDIKAALGRSCDRADALMLATYQTRSVDGRQMVERQLAKRAQAPVANRGERQSRQHKTARDWYRR